MHHASEEIGLASSYTESAPGENHSAGLYWILGMAYMAVIGAAGWALIEPWGSAAAMAAAVAGVAAPLIARRYV